MGVVGKEIILGVITDFADHMTMTDWLDSCQCGAFIDYDGFGNLATATQESNIEVRPSMYVVRDRETRKVRRTNKSIPSWATHIVWYNR